MTSYFTTKEWKALTTAQKLAFGAGNVRRVTFRRAGRLVVEWEVRR